VAAKLHTTPAAQADDLDYMALSPDSQTIARSTWYAAFRSGRPSRRAWLGHLDGSDVHRSGEPDPADLRAQAAEQRLIAAQVRARQALNRHYALASGPQIAVANRKGVCVTDATTIAAVRRCLR
jgi:hypothetical protein